jgi:ferrochelatase
MRSYEALLVVSFGGPEGPDDVMPFLENVTRGRGVPRERLGVVAEHYYRFGGVSPINGQCRELLAAVRDDFAAHGVGLPVYWGNRNWDPFLTETMRRMADDGVRRAVAFATSAYGSYSGSAQYVEDIAHARAGVGERAPAVDKLRPYFNHPGFVDAVTDRTRDALARAGAGARLVFTAHSIPEEMAGADTYVAQFAEASRLVAGRVGAGSWDLVYQSRSGRPGQPWLEPDVCDHLETLHAKGVGDVVLVPIGFVSDHMEVKFDLDVEAEEKAAELGMALVRAPSAGTHPAFVAMVRELVAEISGTAPARVTGDLPAAAHDLDIPARPRTT